MVGRHREARGLMVCMADRVDEELLARFPRLLVVAGVLKGSDNIDVAACARRGVWVTVLDDLLTAPTAELVVGLMVAVMRRVREGDELVRSGGFRGWRPYLYGRGLAGAAVGLVGKGRLGQAVAQRVQAFDARVVYCDPRTDARAVTPVTPGTPAPERVALDELLAVSDVVVPLVPLTPDTHHLLDGEALAALRPGTFVSTPGGGPWSTRTRSLRRSRTAGSVATRPTCSRSRTGPPRVVGGTSRPGCWPIRPRCSPRTWAPRWTTSGGGWGWPPPSRSARRWQGSDPTAPSTPSRPPRPGRPGGTHAGEPRVGRRLSGRDRQRWVPRRGDPAWRDPGRDLPADPPPGERAGGQPRLPRPRRVPPRAWDRRVPALFPHAARRGRPGRPPVLRPRAGRRGGVQHLHLPAAAAPQGDRRRPRRPLSDPPVPRDEPRRDRPPRPRRDRRGPDRMVGAASRLRRQDLAGGEPGRHRRPRPSLGRAGDGRRR